MNVQQHSVTDLGDSPFQEGSGVGPDWYLHSACARQWSGLLPCRVDVIKVSISKFSCKRRKSSQINAQVGTVNVDALRITSLRKFHWLGGNKNVKRQIPQGFLVDIDITWKSKPQSQKTSNRQDTREIDGLFWMERVWCGVSCLAVNVSKKS